MINQHNGSNMTEVAQLIAVAQQNTPETQMAIVRLVEIGMPAVPAIVGAILTGSPSGARNLGQAILRIREPEIVPEMINLLNTDHDYLRSVAFVKLGLSKDERALQPLMQQFLNDAALESDRAWAAGALGELGNPQSVEPLISILRELLDAGMEMVRYRLTLVDSIVVALAKLGNQEYAYLMTDLATDSSPEVRITVVKSLKHLVARGLFSTLQVTMTDNYREIRWDSIEALFYLGSRACIDELMEFVDDPDPEIYNHVRFRLTGLTGERFDALTPQEARNWWVQNDIRFDEDRCYRLGEPMWIPSIIAQLREPGLLDLIFQELRIVTGNDFGFPQNLLPGIDDANEIYEQAERWWNVEGDRFETGALYKHGYRQNLATIY